MPASLCPVVAGTAHAAAMAAIQAQAMPDGEAWGEAAIAAQLTLPGTFGLVDPQGGMVLARVAADEAEILTLAVAPPARRQGRAAALLAAAEARAADAGARTMYLEVAEPNAPARALYARAGYGLAGRRRAYYRDGSDALLLSKGLGDPSRKLGALPQTPPGDFAPWTPTRGYTPTP
jgi:ribosomal-protein-alanine N-acetyltransferase